MIDAKRVKVPGVLEKGNFIDIIPNAVHYLAQDVRVCFNISCISELFKFAVAMGKSPWYKEKTVFCSLHASPVEDDPKLVLHNARLFEQRHRFAEKASCLDRDLLEDRSSL